MTYKPDIADQRESPAKPIAVELIDKGAVVQFHDPYVQTWGLGPTSMECVSNVETAVAEADMCVLLQNHGLYDLDDIIASSRRLFDTRGVTAGPKVVRL